MLRRRPPRVAGDVAASSSEVGADVRRPRRRSLPARRSRARRSVPTTWRRAPWTARPRCRACRRVRSAPLATSWPNPSRRSARSTSATSQRRTERITDALGDVRDDLGALGSAAGSARYASQVSDVDRRHRRVGDRRWGYQRRGTVRDALVAFGNVVTSAGTLLTTFGTRLPVIDVDTVVGVSVLGDADGERSPTPSTAADQATAAAPPRRWRRTRRR